MGVRGTREIIEDTAPTLRANCARRWISGGLLKEGNRKIFSYPYNYSVC